jgi:hypothetical protein
MKIQFRISSLLLGTALVAVCLGGLVAVWKIIEPVNEKDFMSDLAPLLLLSVPVWSPVVSLAYVLGRKAVTVASVVTLAVTEAAAIGCLVWFFP